MGRIDRATVQRILDTADIVEVVSDFVKLRRRGTGYIGLCPFHNERTPSFSVSKTRNICKCFSCGQGGSPVNFIMLHEQLNYNEALRYLARKYNIEIKETELTDEERRAATEREEIFNINEWAAGRFGSILKDTDEGRAVGLSYFRQRGINDEMVSLFRLGYAPESRDAISREALAEGFSREQIISSGLAYQPEGTDELRDRFRGRVIYPVMTISGKVVAFGGRTLKSDKKMAKYVNSPENAAYSKSRELYGLYQARRGIVARDKCLLVEGYMDVISMRQSGIENVVASSGTSLTYGQIRLIHRFTENVTVIYDSDAAGIKAALRSVDMLLSEGLKIKILLLPEGDDPDSFAQSHTSAEVEDYISRNETDFIRFKTQILLADAGDDPIARSRVISDIARSISVIPDEILRASYISDCARRLNFDEKVLALEVAKLRANQAAEASRQRPGTTAGGESDPGTPPSVTDSQDSGDSADRAASAGPGSAGAAAPLPHAGELRQAEKEIARYLVRYAMVSCFTSEGTEEEPSRPVTAMEYVAGELDYDSISFTNPDIARLYKEVAAMGEEHRAARAAFELQAAAEREAALREGIERIGAEHAAEGIGAMERAERELRQRLDDELAAKTDNFDCRFAEQRLVSHLDDGIRALATELVADRHKLSKIHTRYSHVESERERLPVLLPRAVYELKYAILELTIRDLRLELAGNASPERQEEVMRQMVEINNIRKDLAEYLGERTLSARR